MDGNGYGMIGVRSSRCERAHRVAFREFVGPIGAGMVVMHSCDNPPCCNPDHLSIGSVRQNNEDRARKARSADTHGEGHPRAVLNDVAVREIRRLQATGLTAKTIAPIVGFKYHAVFDVMRGRTWTHVT